MARLKWNRERSRQRRRDVTIMSDDHCLSIGPIIISFKLWSEHWPDMAWTMELHLVRLHSLTRRHFILLISLIPGMVIGFEVEGDIGKLRSSLSSAPELLLLLSPESSSDGDVNKFFNYVDMTM